MAATDDPSSVSLLDLSPSPVTLLPVTGEDASAVRAGFGGRAPGYDQQEAMRRGINANEYYFLQSHDKLKEYDQKLFELTRGTDNEYVARVLQDLGYQYSPEWTAKSGGGGIFNDRTAGRHVGNPEQDWARAKQLGLESSDYYFLQQQYWTAYNGRQDSSLERFVNDNGRNAQKLVKKLRQDPASLATMVVAPQSDGAMQVDDEIAKRYGITRRELHELDEFTRARYDGKSFAEWNQSRPESERLQPTGDGAVSRYLAVVRDDLYHNDVNQVWAARRAEYARNHRISPAEYDVLDANARTISTMDGKRNYNGFEEYYQAAKVAGPHNEHNDVSDLHKLALTWGYQQTSEPTPTIEARISSPSPPAPPPAEGAGGSAGDQKPDLSIFALNSAKNFGSQSDLITTLEAFIDKAKGNDGNLYLNDQRIQSHTDWNPEQKRIAALQLYLNEKTRGNLAIDGLMGDLTRADFGKQIKQDVSIGAGLSAGHFAATKTFLAQAAAPTPAITLEAAARPAPPPAPPAGALPPADPPPAARPPAASTSVQPPIPVNDALYRQTLPSDARSLPTSGNFGDLRVVTARHVRIDHFDDHGHDPYASAGKGISRRDKGDVYADGSSTEEIKTSDKKTHTKGDRKIISDGRGGVVVTDEGKKPDAGGHQCSYHQRLEVKFDPSGRIISGSVYSKTGNVTETQAAFGRDGKLPDGKPLPSEMRELLKVAQMKNRAATLPSPVKSF